VACRNIRHFTPEPGTAANPELTTASSDTGGLRMNPNSVLSVKLFGTAANEIGRVVVPQGGGKAEINTNQLNLDLGRSPQPWPTTCGPPCSPPAARGHPACSPSPTRKGCSARPAGFSCPGEGSAPGVRPRTSADAPPLAVSQFATT
jgi:hypothetical protein